MRQRYSQNLIWTHGRILFVPGNRVVQATRLFIPKDLVEATRCTRRKASILFGGAALPRTASEVLHDPEGVVPKCLNFDRLSVSRCHHPVSNFRIHPRELNRWVA